MIFKFWEKQKELSTKKLLLRKLIRKVDLPETDKTLFLEAIWVVPDENIENLYNEVISFIKNFELKEIDEIEKNNFVSIDGMTLKEAENKKREINSFNFLLTNI